ncbi:23S rRNA (adenine(2503)-C(2))-methyltransferase RlmN [Candidatus Dojkabacteria bacterium]|nr:23S rRNA (adenine(2503)-C(2))-methyltransferase RlmN [Candidatus Dojkabacteria bacterium]
MRLNSIYNLLGNEPSYRLKQVKHHIFIDLIETWTSATTLPKKLRENLELKCPLDIKALFLKSKDENTIKALITLNDDKRIETVLMRHKDRNTVCVSTQVGCPLSCTFCATGRMGFVRNLEWDEIVEQVVLFARYLKKKNVKVTNVVFMGMGEPFLNYENVIQAIEVINDEDSFNIGARRISISTSGIVEGIKRLADEGLQINLAISLHAPTDELRSSLMPINDKYPLDTLMKSIDEYIKKTRRKVMFEYILIDKINDSKEHAFELARLLKGKLCLVNLIPCNPVGEFHPSERSRIIEFKSVLEREGINVVQRFSFGQDIKAACGQLAGAFS